MNRLLTVTLLALVTTAQADELKISESGEMIIVESVGTPSEKSSARVKVSMTDNSPDSQRARYLTDRIEQMRREAEDILEMSGNENEDELRFKNTLADENERQIEIYSEELSRIKRRPPLAAEPPAAQQNKGGA